MTYKRVSDSVCIYFVVPILMEKGGKGRKKIYNNNHENDDEKWQKIG